MHIAQKTRKNTTEALIRPVVFGFVIKSDSIIYKCISRF